MSGGFREKPGGRPQGPVVTDRRYNHDATIHNLPVLVIYDSEQNSETLADEQFDIELQKFILVPAWRSNVPLHRSIVLSCRNTVPDRFNTVWKRNWNEIPWFKIEALKNNIEPFQFSVEPVQFNVELFRFKTETFAEQSGNKRIALEMPLQPQV